MRPITHDSSSKRLWHACAIAGSWLLVLTLLNRSLDGVFRNAILYAVPIALVAWYDSTAGFIFSALGAISAWIGGAIPSPHIEESVVIEGMWAFAKLSAVVWGVNYGKARAFHSRAQDGDGPDHHGTKR